MTIENNYFKFIVYHNNKKIHESIFDADCYNPQTRQSVNIKNLVPSIRRSLQRVLSTPTSKLENSYYVGLDKSKNKVNIPINDTIGKNLSKRWDYLSRPSDNNSIYLKDTDINSENINNLLLKATADNTFYVQLKDGNSKIYNKTNLIIEPQNLVDKTDNTKIKFTSIKFIEFLEEYQFKFSLFINSNYIIERKFTVYNFNPESLLSKDFIDCNKSLIKEIQNFILKSDLNQIYDDGYLIEMHGLNIPQIRALTPEQRTHLLKTHIHYDYTEDKITD